MPREKDFKRHVRLRMAGTGERYTRAREQLRAENRPFNWRLVGDRPEAYQLAVEVDERVPGRQVHVLSCTGDAGGGFGALSASLRADHHRGQRVRFAFSLRGEDVSVSAGLAVYITDARGETVAFDDMWDRQLQGTFGWTPAAIVLDVPEQAVGISYGVALIGSGAVGVSDVRLEVVDDDTPVTTRRVAAGWALNSDNLNLYEVEDEPYERSPGERQALLRSTMAEPGNNGALTRWTTTGEHRGKLVRFTAALRGEDVESGTGLWISSTAEKPTEEGLATASQEPMLKGTFGWREEAVMVAIPEDAAGVVYGVTLSGHGAVYVAQPRLEIVNE